LTIFCKAYVQKTYRALERAVPSELGFHVRTPHKAFTVYESTADKIGLFQTGTVKALVVFYTSAHAYLNLVDDYGQAMAGVVRGELHSKPMAITLLDFVKNNTSQMVPLLKLVTKLLATEAGTHYELEPAERIVKPHPSS
jgi:hypothetical protein